MLPQNNRLTKKKEIDLVFKKGKTSFDGVLGIKAIKNKTENTRICVITGTKVSKKAVERNKIKRRIKDIVYNTVLGKTADNYDLVIITLKEAKNKKFSELSQSIIVNLKKLKIV